MISSYGIASVEELGPDVLKVKHLVEKPALEEAPSNLGIAGTLSYYARYFRAYRANPCR